MDGRWKDLPTPNFPTPPPSPRRIVLELEGILYDDSSWERWLFQLLGRVGLRTSFYRFHAVWRHDYFAGVTVGESSPEDALRRFLTAMGIPDGTVYEICAAAVCRQRRDIDQPVLFPGAEIAIRRLAALGVPLLACHQGNRTTTQWSLTLTRWHLTSQFDEILAWPESGPLSTTTNNSAIPPQVRSLASEDVWYVSCDSARSRSARDIGMTAIAYGLEEPLCEQPARVDSLVELQTLIATATRRRQAA